MEKKEELSIYYDKDEKELLYPEKALTESGLMGRNIQVTKDWPLIWDHVEGFYYHKNGEKYLCFKSPAEFEKQRLSRIDTDTRINLRAKADWLPIYYEDDSELWYYPKEALLETELRARIVLTGRPLLR